MRFTLPARIAAHLFSAVLLLSVAGTGRAANLIVNGDFEAGFSGFSSDYASPSASGCIGCAGVNSNTLNWYFAPSLVVNFNDHTSGSGLMLLYDPAEPPSTKRIWYQTVNVVAGNSYTFSGWAREANSENPNWNNGLIQFEANGLVLGTLASVEHEWTQFSANYVATSTGAITLALRDINASTYFGTYTAVDDLSFTPTAIPEPETYALMLAGLALLGGYARRGRRLAAG